jgi:hypothetical protein
MNQLDPIIPVDTNMQLDEAISIATHWEGTLGTSSKGKAQKAFEALRQGKFEIKDPHSYTRCLNINTFKELKQQLSPSVVATLSASDGYRVYLIGVPVLLFPGRGAQYRRVGCHCTFSTADKKGHQPAVHAVFPESRWKAVLALGGEMELAADANLDFGVEIPQLPEELQKLLPKLVPELKGRVATKGHLKSFVKLLSFQFDLGRMEITAQGAGDNAIWYLDSKTAIRAQKHMQFISVVKVPHDIERIKIDVAAEAQVSYDWLIPQIQHIWEQLKHILDRPKALALQDFKTWALELPRS